MIEVEALRLSSVAAPPQIVIPTPIKHRPLKIVTCFPLFNTSTTGKSLVTVDPSINTLPHPTFFSLDRSAQVRVFFYWVFLLALVNIGRAGISCTIITTGPGPIGDGRFVRGF